MYISVSSLKCIIVVCQIFKLGNRLVNFAWLTNEAKLETELKLLVPQYMICDPLGLVNKMYSCTTPFLT